MANADHSHVQAFLDEANVQDQYSTESTRNGMVAFIPIIHNTAEQMTSLIRLIQLASAVEREPSIKQQFPGELYTLQGVVRDMQDLQRSVEQVMLGLDQHEAWCANMQRTINGEDTELPPTGMTP